MQSVRRLHPIADAEFGQDGFDMVANGFGAEVQRGSDRRVTVAGGQQVRN
jgi:hypothetical protein